jgi:ubiquinone/menaquinone biosynthesis C-methylase UbiE
VSTPEDVKARVAHAYNHLADHYDAAANAFWQRAGRRTVERLRLAPGARVLDLCCGTGASALPAAQAVGTRGRVVAVDLAAELVALGRAKAEKLGIAHVDFRVADVLELDFEREPFDVAICVFGIFFFPDMAAALAKIASFVRPGGRLAVTTWGAGLFEPVNSLLWEAIGRVRPELHKVFNPWDRLGERERVLDLFAQAGLPEPAVELETGSDTLRGEADLSALLMGTGYRGVMEQLSAEQRALVLREVAARTFPRPEAAIRTDVLYASCAKSG